MPPQADASNVEHASTSLRLRQIHRRYDRSDSFVLYRALVLGRSRRYGTEACAAHRAAKREAFDANGAPALGTLVADALARCIYQHINLCRGAA
jgi:hypothetical protein